MSSYIIQNVRERRHVLWSGAGLFAPIGPNGDVDH